MPRLGLLFLTMCLSVPSPVWATSGESHAVCKVQWQKLVGRVEGCDLNKHSLALRDKNGNLAQVVVDGKVQIFKNWKLVALDDVAVNDHVILRRVSAEP